MLPVPRSSLELAREQREEDTTVMLGPQVVAARLAGVLLLAAAAAGHGGVQPLSRIAIHRARVALDASAAVRASPALLGTKVRPLCPLIRMLLFVLSSPRAWTICVLGSLARRLPSSGSYTKSCI